jgi:hypothetical protein
MRNLIVEQTRPTQMLRACVPYGWPNCVQKRAETISARYRASDGDLPPVTAWRQPVLDLRFAKCHFYAGCSVGAPVSGRSLGWLLVGSE